jgi:superfamily I DNA/RNA helicase
VVPEPIAAIGATIASDPPRTPTPSQREAIEAPLGPVLVLAGPGAGKTFCLIERIRFLIEQRGLRPERVCVFTFTNKAAGEIASRLSYLGARAECVKRGTIHAFCAELLRDHGTHVGLEPGFGIADENYQLFVLRRLEGDRRWHRKTLTRFSAHRFCGEALFSDDIILFARYEQFLAEQKMLDFDTLVLKTAELLELTSAPLVRKKWDAILVDECQDLNPVQYRIIRELARDHRNVFAVGDHEQSIYSWAGADPAVLKDFLNDFRVAAPIYLQENFRCPRNVFELARSLVAINTPLFSDGVEPLSDLNSTFPVAAYEFDSDDAELAWITEDIRRDHVEHGYDWGHIALLYRKHEIGEGLEGAFLNAGLPCRLAQGHALAEDPVVSYLLAALRVIASPKDDVYRDQFFASLLPKPLFDELRAQAESVRWDLRRHLNHILAQRPRADESARQIRRALRAWRNLEAVGRRHSSVDSLIQELLSQRVGRRQSVLDEAQDQITDPADHPGVVSLTERLRAARDRDSVIWIPRLGGVDIALKGMLSSIGFRHVELGGSPPGGAELLMADDTPSLGMALGLFKAAQLLEIGDLSSAFRDFTAIDLETTDKDTGTCEVVEISAVRVRNGVMVEEFSSLVKPRVPIAEDAAEVHNIRASDVVSSPHFELVWPAFRAFCGDDVIVAHNGYEFDFRVLRRMLKSIGKDFDLCPFDSIPLARDLYPTSRKLTELARKFTIDTGRSHRALDDARTLAQVFVKLNEAKLCRARKTALVSALSYLGVALAASDESSLCHEAQLFRRISRSFALGRYSDCLEYYEREQAGDESVLSVDELIERLGGAELMVRIRSEKTADERYPAAMLRLRRLIAEIPIGRVDEQLSAFLERVVLSTWDRGEAVSGRINLLTLHSTKGLEFSRVYIVGAEDSELPGGSPMSAPKLKEIEEARRLLYVGMTRTQHRLILTCVRARKGKSTGGHRFLDEMGLVPLPPAKQSNH